MLSLISSSSRDGGNDGVDFLPRDCMHHILQYCDPKTTCTSYLVCSFWYHAVDRCVCAMDAFYYLPSVSLHTIATKCRWSSSKLLSLQTLRHDERWDYIQYAILPSLENGDGETLPPALEDLTIGGAYCDVAFCASSRTLRKLDVSQCKTFSTASIKGLEIIPTLEDLNLSGTNISGVSNLSVCLALRRLDLSLCKGLTSIRGLELIATLEEIDLRNTQINDVTCLSLSVSLRVLGLRKCSKIADASIWGLETIPTLQDLDLGKTKIHDISRLTSCRSLRTLDLGDCYELTDTGIRGLEHIPTLMDLNLSDTCITSVSLLSQCPALRTLTAHRCPNLTNDGIRGLETIPTLEELDLYGNFISDVSHLSCSRSLRRLYVCACGDLSEIGGL
eukprot:PhF_6_TR30176/c1_g2_i8/m.44296